MTTTSGKVIRQCVLVDDEVLHCKPMGYSTKCKKCLIFLTAPTDNYRPLQDAWD